MDKISSKKDVELFIRNVTDHSRITTIGRALSIPERLLILQKLLTRSMNLLELSKELDLPLSSVSRHIDVLLEAQLIYVNYQPGLKGHAKLCSKMLMKTTISFEELKSSQYDYVYKIEMPIGLFNECEVTSPCGINGIKFTLGGFDDPSIFFSPERMNAESLWFNTGFITYRFPLTNMNNQDFQEILFSFEVCSETVNYNSHWPSDITILINDLEVATFTSPGDFGGRRGKFTPIYWPISSTQFGILKTITVNKNGVFIDNVKISTLHKFNDLKIFNSNNVKLTIGVKPDAVHKGGINLFGKNFGDFSQSIIMELR